MPDGINPVPNAVTLCADQAFGSTIPDARQRLVALLGNEEAVRLLRSLNFTLTARSIKADDLLSPTAKAWIEIFHLLVRSIPNTIIECSHPNTDITPFIGQARDFARSYRGEIKGYAGLADSDREALNKIVTDTLLEAGINPSLSDSRPLDFVARYFEEIAKLQPFNEPAHPLVVIDVEPDRSETRPDAANKAADLAREKLQEVDRAKTRRRRIMATFALAAVAVVAVVGAVAAHYGVDLASVQDTVTTVGEQLNGLGTSIAKIWSQASPEVTQQATTLPPATVLPTLNSVSDAVQVATSSPPVLDQANTAGLYIGQEILPEYAARPFNLQVGTTPFELSNNGVAKAISQPAALDTVAQAKPVARTGTGVGRRMTEAAINLAQDCRHLMTEQLVRQSGVIRDFANSVVAIPSYCTR